MHSLTFLGLSALGLALALTPVFRRLYFRLGWFDRPDSVRKLHSRPIPRAGGVPLIAAYGASFALLMFSPLEGGELIRQALPLAGRLIPAALVVFATGLLDDLIGLKPLEKLAGQLCGAGLACWAGVAITGIGNRALPAWAAIPLTLLWLAACTNAFNLIDGIDGLAAGVGLVATLTTMIAAVAAGHTGLALATAPLAGALLGFLRFNFNPASIFLGDSGSLTIGFLLGCYAVIWSHKTDTLLGMTAPVMALSIPLLEIVLSVARRFLRGQPIFSADREHIHHKLLARGFTQRHVALLFYGVASVAAVFSLVQSAFSGKFAGLVTVLFCLAAWWGVRRLGYVEFGIAGKLIVPTNFLRLISAQIRLRSLQDELSRAETLDQCWQAIAAASRDFGFARVVLRLAGTNRDEWLRTPASPSGCWMLRVPLSDTDYVNVGNDFGALVEPMFLARFASVLRTALEPRLPLFGGGLVRVAPAPRTGGRADRSPSAAPPLPAAT
ncbi:MAG TPA: MraY family glycosyltransferase [Bryobacteraceae bacterium]|nr:MraY family glycosyltransferase [Bryobacteraceae bacterium]